MNFRFHFAIANDHPSLPGHFPGHPMVPGVLVLDNVLRNMAREVRQPVALLQQVRFPAALLGGEVAEAQIEVVGREVEFCVGVQRGDVTVTVANGRLLLADRHTDAGAIDSS